MIYRRLICLFLLLLGTAVPAQATPPKSTSPADLTRSSSSDITYEEYILEDAPADKVMNFLKTQFREVEFTPHPLRNGFCARGPREELRLIRRSLANLDSSWCHPPPPLPEVDGGYWAGGEPLWRGYRDVVLRPASTFPIKVDTGSYDRVQSFLQQGLMPPREFVRVEELINAVRYDYPEPSGDSPFAVMTELSVCPWNSEHQLLRIGIQARRPEAVESIARDVKIQVEFNPMRISSYRLIGCESPPNLGEVSPVNDLELPAGHSVTALYELIPDGAPVEWTLRYQNPPTRTAAARGTELATIQLRYKPVEGGSDQRLELPISNRPVIFADASADHRFAASVAVFGMLLADSEFRGQAELSKLRGWVGDSASPNASRQGFLHLVEMAEALKRARG